MDEVKLEGELLTHQKSMITGTCVRLIKLGKNSQIELNTTSYTFITTLCNSNFHCKSSEIIGSLNPYVMYYFPANNKILLSTSNYFNSLGVISFPASTIEKTVERYSLKKKNLNDLLSQSRIISKNNWLNEIVQRLFFEIFEDKCLDSIVNFLIPEILKQIYYNYLNKTKNLEHLSFLDEAGLNTRNEVLKKGIYFVEQNLLKKINLTQFAKEMNCSKSTLIRSFKNEIGFTPIQYVKDRRLQVAYTMLKGKDKSVSEVSFLLGYEDVSAFISAFKTKYSITPSKI